MAQVGQQPLAADGRRAPGRSARAPRSPRTAPRRRGRAAAGAQPRSRSASSSVSSSPPASSSARVRPRNEVSAGGAHPARAVGLLERLEQGQPLVAGRRREQLGAAADDGRDAAGGELRARTSSACGPLADQDGDVSRPRSARRPRSRRRRAGSRCRRRSRRAMCRRASSARIRPRASLKPRALAPGAPGTAPGAARPPAGCPGGRRSTSRTTIRGSPRAAPRSTTWSASTQVGVAAPVGVERRLGGRRAGGREVGDDVAATEGVDGLLRVADQHHRGVAGEGPVEHLPLHGVGVLELVDQHDLPALPHPLPGRRVVVRRARRRGGRAGRRTTGSRGVACAGRPRARTSPANATRAPASDSLSLTDASCGMGVADHGARQGERGVAAERRIGGLARRSVLRYTSSTTSTTRSSSDSTRVAPVSVSPATPSERSTVWQNWWVVAMVAASNDASASRSRSCRSPTSSRPAAWRSPGGSGRRSPGRPAPARPARAARAPARAAPGWRPGRT